MKHKHAYSKYTGLCNCGEYLDLKPTAKKSTEEETKLM